MSVDTGRYLVELQKAVQHFEGEVEQLRIDWRDNRGFEMRIRILKAVDALRELRVVSERERLRRHVAPARRLVRRVESRRTGSAGRRLTPSHVSRPVRRAPAASSDRRSGSVQTNRPHQMIALGRAEYDRRSQAPFDPMAAE